MILANTTVQSKWLRHLWTPNSIIDYGCEDGKKLASREATLVPLDGPELPLPENPDHHPAIQKMHLSKQLLSRGLKLSNSKPAC